MKKYMSITLIFLFVQLQVFAEMKYGQLTALAKGNSHFIFIDEVKQGSTPLRNKNLVVGEHLLRAVNEETFKTAFDSKIKINEGELTTIIVDQIQEAPVIENEKKNELSKDNVESNALKLAQYNSEKKDAGFAVLLSVLIAGGGQFYNGETGKGIAFLVGELLSYALMYNRQITYDSWGYAYYSYPNAQLGALCALGIWIGSMADAGMSASNINEELKKKYGLSSTLINNSPAVQFSYRF